MVNWARMSTKHLENIERMVNNGENIYAVMKEENLSLHTAREIIRDIHRWRELREQSIKQGDICTDKVKEIITRAFTDAYRAGYEDGRKSNE